MRRFRMNLCENVSAFYSKEKHALSLNVGFMSVAVNHWSLIWTLNPIAAGDE